MPDQSVIGVTELAAKYRQLASEMSTRAARSIAVAGASLLRSRAKKLATGYNMRRTGALLKNIVIKRETQVPSGTVQYNLGVRHGKNLTKKQKSTGALAIRGGRIVNKDDPFYWRFLELGWSPRGAGQALRGSKAARKAARASSGNKVPGRSFIGKALEVGPQAVIDAMSARLDKEIEKAQTK